MGLWADNGSGHPGALLAQSGNIAVVPGINSATPTPVPPATVTQVTGGKTYWVGAKFLNGVHLYQNASPGLVGYKYGQAFGTSLIPEMSTFPAASTTFANTALNLFFLVQDIPP
jgi:hypothetical protein